jgi:broad specificity phosphatase PhoE
MSRLVLVRHAAPVIDPQSPSERWILSPEGAAAAAELGGKLARYEPRRILCGDEPKMTGTADALSAVLGIAVMRATGLSEHARRTTKFGEKTAFEAAIRSLFERPDEIVYGEESADMTYARFAAAIDAALADERGTLLAVSGGTAISIFLSRRAGVDAFETWKTLKLPMAVVLDRRTWNIERTV